MCWENVLNAPMVPPPQTIPNRIEQIEASKVKPKTSAQMALEVNFYFNNTPLAHLFTKVIGHKKLGQPKYWDPHEVEGCYLGPAV